VKSPECQSFLDNLIASLAQVGSRNNPHSATGWSARLRACRSRGIFSARVRGTALAIIDGGKDVAMMQQLGMEPADPRKRAAKLAKLRALPCSAHDVETAQNHARARALCVRGGRRLRLSQARRRDDQSHMSPRRFDRSIWSPDGFGLMLVIGRGASSIMNAFARRDDRRAMAL
jgi:hypothetical protein